MTTRFVAQDLEWTEPMRDLVRVKVIKQIQRYLHSDNFELSIHLREVRKRMNARKPQFEIWIVLQTFDGRNNQVVRREGEDFHKLVIEAGHGLKELIKKDHERQKVRQSGQVVSWA